MDVLIRLASGIAHLTLRERSLRVSVAASDEVCAGNVSEVIATALPEVEQEPDDREVPVRFWWSHSGGTRALARMLPCPPWETIAYNYVEATRATLEQMMAWRNAPPPGGRLLLWEGDPGTGKTSAIRALASEWRDWADFSFITDPEQFLMDPSYLLDVISGRLGSPRSEPEHWQVVVLEDCGEYLAPDAKHVAGQALSRLLNVCDGALGQAMKVLVLVTTNESLHTLHPALSRPGRCLAEVSFGRFDREAIEAWAVDAAVEPPAASSATLAELYAHAEGRAQRTTVREAFGFAARSGT